MLVKNAGVQDYWRRIQVEIFPFFFEDAPKYLLLIEFVEFLLLILFFNAHGLIRVLALYIYSKST